MAVLKYSPNLIQLRVFLTASGSNYRKNAQNLNTRFSVRSGAKMELGFDPKTLKIDLHLICLKANFHINKPILALMFNFSEIVRHTISQVSKSQQKNRISFYLKQIFRLGQRCGNVCILTLRVSRGWPVYTEAVAPNAPEIKSIKSNLVPESRST